MPESWRSCNEGTALAIAQLLADIFRSQLQMAQHFILFQFGQLLKTTQSHFLRRTHFMSSPSPSPFRRVLCLLRCVRSRVSHGSHGVVLLAGDADGECSERTYASNLEDGTFCLFLNTHVESSLIIHLMHDVYYILFIYTPITYIYI